MHVIDIRICKTLLGFIHKQLCVTAVFFLPLYFHHPFCVYMRKICISRFVDNSICKEF
jgi:hypothetical protein